MFWEDRNNNKNCYYSSKMAGGESTRNIAADYIGFRLENQNNYRWENGRGGNISPTDVQLAMRELGNEFEDKFRARFDNMIQQLHVTEDNAHETFRAIVHEIFDDGVNWGRVVALFGFASKFSALCVEKDMANMVDHIVDWVTLYVDNDLADWMTRNNGWAGFLTFHDGPDSKKENGWPNMRTIGGYALAGLGVITLGAFLTQRS